MRTNQGKIKCEKKWKHNLNPEVKIVIEMDPNLTQMLELVDEDFKASSKNMFKDF